MKIIKGLILLGWLGILSPGSAQDIKADILKLNAAYRDHTGFRADVTYKLFPSYKATKAVNTVKGTIRKQGKRQYTKLGAMESIINENYAILLNHDDQVLSLQAASSPPTSQELPVELDSILSLCRNIHFEQRDAHSHAYTFEFGDYVYDQIVLVFDPQSWLIHKFVFYTSEAVELPQKKDPTKVRVEIEYLQPQFDPVFPEHAFSEAQFLTRANGKFTPTAPFHTYQFVNYLSE